MDEISRSEITPERLYLSRRKFMVVAGSVTTGVLLAACGVQGQNAQPAMPTTANPTSGSAGALPTALPAAGGSATPRSAVAKDTDELGAKLTPFDSITNYNNFYEFSTDKAGVAAPAQHLKMSPWQVQVGGLVGKPRTYTIEDLLAFEQQERIYRLRCVEAWSMVIPWTGFPLSALLKQVEPKPDAKYVRFETLLDANQMPGQKDSFFPWPYIEGLRLDEAMNDLAILATGLYGKPLPPQDGGPIRLVVPWKYGFKSGKSLVKIDLVAEMPQTFWMKAGPDEYGFYANVNPNVPHPRWSQETERRIGELTRRKTILFNGYGDQVAHLYDGMDLKANF